MADERNRDRMSDERFGRHVHEGMNAGISRNAHVSGGAPAVPPNADAPRPEGATERPASPPTTGQTPPAPHGTHSAWAGTSSISHHDGVGSEAPSGMEELEHDAWERGEQP